MNKTRYECTTFYEAVSCECGGSFMNEVGALSFLTNPPQKEYGCNECGATKILSLENFPQMRCIVGNKIADA